jgi:hypothetical protein
MRSEVFVYLGIFCPADSAVLKNTASNHTNASSSMFQSIAAGPAANLVTCGVGSAGFSGGAAASAAGAGGGAGAAAAASAGARRRWRRQRELAWDHGWVGHGSSLGDELAGQVLGRWTSPSAGFLADVVVECGERVAELCPKFVMGHGIGFSTYQYHLAFY